MLRQRVFVTLVSLEVRGATLVTITLTQPDGTTIASESVSSHVTTSPVFSHCVCCNEVAETRVFALTSRDA